MIFLNNMSYLFFSNQFQEYNQIRHPINFHECSLSTKNGEKFVLNNSYIFGVI